MPDGTRKRRFSPIRSRREWYAQHRAQRFFRRFGLGSTTVGGWDTPARAGTLAA